MDIANTPQPDPGIGHRRSKYRLTVWLASGYMILFIASRVLPMLVLNKTWEMSIAGVCTETPGCASVSFSKVEHPFQFERKIHVQAPPALAPRLESSIAEVTGKMWMPYVQLVVVDPVAKRKVK